MTGDAADRQNKNAGINYASGIVYTVFGASLWDASEQNMSSGIFCSDFSAAFPVPQKTYEFFHDFNGHLTLFRL